MQTTITFADDDQVTSAKLNQIVSGLSFTATDITGSTLAVVGGQLKVGTITSSEMGALSIATGSLQDLSVTTAKIAAGAVTNEKLGNNSVSGTKLTSQAVAYANLESTIFATQGQMEGQTANKLVRSEVAKHAPSAAKAYGSFAITGSGRTIQSNSFNVASLTRVSATQTTVTLTDNMNSANYTVQVSGISDGTEFVNTSYYDKAAGSFKIFHTTEGSGRGVAFAVFGQYA